MLLGKSSKVVLRKKNHLYFYISIKKRVFTREKVLIKINKYKISFPFNSLLGHQFLFLESTTTSSNGNIFFHNFH